MVGGANWAMKGGDVRLINALCLQATYQGSFHGLQYGGTYDYFELILSVSVSGSADVTGTVRIT